MCGRLNLSDLEGIRKMMADIGMPLFDTDDHQIHYNIAPTSTLQALVTHETSVSWQQMHWGMPLHNGPLVINARVETVSEKVTFKNILHQRALVPVNGFYEWQRRHGERNAWHFESADEPALALAAIWRLSDEMPQLALLTTAADKCMESVHHRMPIAVGSKQALGWLSGIAPLISAPHQLKKRQVSSWVDSARHQGPDCLAEPVNQPHTPDLFD